MSRGRIVLDHGEGGAATARLVRDVFVRHLGGPAVLEDGAIVEAAARVVLTTDTFVVRPFVFPGGDIGTLAVAGTVNDLAVMGATPKYLTAGFVLEEGLPIDDLDAIVISMARTADEAGVRVVAGDTKVVGRGQADGIYINTSGLGILPDGCHLSSAGCRPDDCVIVSGPIGDHGMAVVIARERFGIAGPVESDCRPVADLVAAVLTSAPHTRCMRDPTRGGLATTLIDFSEASAVGIRVREVDVPVRPAVRAACDVLGLDPFYVPCEGRLVAVVPPDECDAALRALRALPFGRDAMAIGTVIAAPRGLFVETSVGGLRPMSPLEGAQLPRIC